MGKITPPIKFVRIENLSGRAKEAADRAGFTEGLGILRFSIHPVPQYEVELVEGEPIDKLMEIAEKEGISQQVIDKAISEASSSNNE